MSKSDIANRLVLVTPVWGNAFADDFANRGSGPLSVYEQAAKGKKRAHIHTEQILRRIVSDHMLALAARDAIECRISVPLKRNE